MPEHEEKKLLLLKEAEQKLRNKSGTTMVEILVSLVILTLALQMLLTCMRLSSGLTRSSREQDVRYSKAEETLAKKAEPGSAAETVNSNDYLEFKSESGTNIRYYVGTTQEGSYPIYAKETTQKNY